MRLCWALLICATTRVRSFPGDLPFDASDVPDELFDNGRFDPSTWKGKWERFVASQASRRRLLTNGTAVPTPSPTATPFPSAAPTWTPGPTVDSTCGLAPLEPCCLRCEDLQKCSVINGYLLEDKIAPTQKHIAGSCQNLDHQAIWLLDTDTGIFGSDKTFRSSDQCKSLVLEYLCLFWGSENPMYENRCAQEPYNEEYSINELAMPPCRHFCTEVALTCANSLYWIDLCDSIACPPYTKAEGCIPPPSLEGADTTESIACLISKYRSPYSAAPPMSDWVPSLVVRALGTLLALAAM